MLATRPKLFDYLESLTSCSTVKEVPLRGSRIPKGPLCVTTVPFCYGVSVVSDEGLGEAESGAADVSGDSAEETSLDSWVDTSACVG